jgi:CIC family chloride channel protein
MTGILSLTDIRQVLVEKELRDLVIAKDVAMEKVITVTPEDSLNAALKKMTKAEIRELPVVGEEDSGQLISMISRKDILRTYNNSIEELKRDQVRGGRLTSPKRIRGLFGIGPKSDGGCKA